YGCYGKLRRSAYAAWGKSRRQGLESLGRHNPIVDQSTFDTSSWLFSAEATVYQLDNPDFPLRRFVRCALCDGVYTAGWSKGRNPTVRLLPVRQVPADLDPC